MDSIAYGGLDVHKDTIVAYVFNRETGEVISEEVRNDKPKVLKAVRRWCKLGELRLCYEASGAGFVLKRWLDSEKVDCQVIARSLIPKAPGDKVKTDKRDARRLAMLYAAGLLRKVRVPDEQEEQVRAFMRLRQDVTQDIVRAKHRIGSYLRSLGQVYSEAKPWTKKHRAWLRGRQLPGIAGKVLATYLEVLSQAEERRKELDKQIEEIAQSQAYRERVERLKCLRGVQNYSAMALISEIGEVERFGQAPQLMAYFGLVPREASSGNQRWQGSITHGGSSHARWILTEAAWNQTRTPNASQRLTKQWAGQPPEVVEIAKRALKRLNSKFWKVANRKDRQKAVVAVAREMAGFVWAILMVKAPQAA